jgi:hypothetical protein
VFALKRKFLNKLSDIPRWLSDIWLSGINVGATPDLCFRVESDGGSYGTRNIK